MRINFEGTPIDYAKSLTAAELKKAIKTCRKGEYDEYADRCRVCFERFLSGDIQQAEWWSSHAELVRE